MSVNCSLIAVNHGSGDAVPMVEITGLPPPPPRVPDPASCTTFSGWVRELTDQRRYGVRQRILAEVAGTTPQAVSKWLKGGAIEADRLARIAEWTGVSYQALRLLVDEPKLRLSAVRVAEQPSVYGKTDLDELREIWAKLTPENKQQLLGMAKVLRSTQFTGDPARREQAQARLVAAQREYAATHAKKSK